MGILWGPAVLILDEPANGLDPEGIAWLRGLLRDYARSSHVLPEVEQLADQVVIMHFGRLVRHGPLAEIAGGRGGLEQAFLSLTAGLRCPGASHDGAADRSGVPQAAHHPAVAVAAVRVRGVDGRYCALAIVVSQNPPVLTAAGQHALFAIGAGGAGTSPCWVP